MRAPHPDVLTGWGRSPRAAGRLVASEDFAAATRDANLARGLGRAYGDAAVPARPTDVIAESPPADRILGFDADTGLLHVEAGVSLAELNRLFLPRGYFTPVTPGTQFVTIGGMVAADVHGKNHHSAGCFGEHVAWLVMRLADGRMLICSPDREPELFWATVGGMGLTGHILEVAFRMERVPSPWLVAETERIDSLDAMIGGLQAAAREWPFTVGWVDCLVGGSRLGRGILFRGRWAEAAEAPTTNPTFRRRLTVPFELPDWVVGRWSMRLFNLALYHSHRRRVKREVANPQGFFYPLDVFNRWNLGYGRRGLTQHQCVLPHGEGHAPTRRFLDLALSLGVTSLLTVFKEFGAEGRGLLSFPRPGITVTLDMPVRDDTQAIVDRLNQQVIAEGGRIYLAKDAFTRAADFARMEPRLDRWQAVRRRFDPAGRIRSGLSVRLLGDTP
jgi:decaprenylphospho-beta-D-ribofuranose 2-oxidase